MFAVSKIDDSEGYEQDVRARVLDQKYRAALSANMRGKGDSLSIVYGVKKEDLNDYLWKLQGEIDSLFGQIPAHLQEKARGLAGVN